MTYLDTGCFVKLYYPEPDSAQVVALIQGKAVCHTLLHELVVGAIGRSQKGIQFDAIDGGLVKLVMLFLVPQGKFQNHVDTFAKIAKLLHDPEFRRRFL